MNRIKFQLFLWAALLCTGCASNQHLVFFTHSSIGVDISTEPQTATPFKFVVGYKRQEGVIDPIGMGYHLHESDDAGLPVVPPDMNAPVLPTKAGYFVQRGTAAEPHSVLAKMNFGATGGGAGASAAQWFATGEAAKILARQPGIPGAIAGDPEVNKSTKTIELASGMKISQLASLSNIYQNIKDYIAQKGKESVRAGRLIERVDKLDTGEFRVPFRRYQLTSGGQLKWETLPNKRTSASFTNVTQYLSNLQKSYEAAVKAAKKTDIKKTDGSSLSDPERNDLIEAVATYPSRLKDIEARMAQNKDAIEMVEFYCENVLLATK